MANLFHRRIDRIELALDTNECDQRRSPGWNELREARAKAL